MLIISYCVLYLKYLNVLFSPINLLVCYVKQTFKFYFNFRVPVALDIIFGHKKYALFIKWSFISLGTILVSTYTLIISY